MTVSLSTADWLRVVMFGLGQLSVLVACLWKFNSRLTKLESVVEALGKAEVNRAVLESKVTGLDNRLVRVETLTWGQMPSIKDTTTSPQETNA